VKKLWIAMVLLIFLALSKDNSHTATISLQASYDQGIHKLTCDKMNGTGVMVSPNFMTTAAHVVGKSRHCTITVQNKVIVFTVERIEIQNDFALLKTTQAFPKYRTINCDGVQSSQTYEIAGYPYGNSFAKSQAKPVDLYYNMSDGPTQHMRAVTAETKDGMSGGPVIQSDGQVSGYLVGKVIGKINHDVIKEYRDVSLCDPR
jgi:V8-like Glu-specific endopeptidase